MTRVCQCGILFRTYPSKIKSGRGKYCSKECSDKNTLFKPGISYSKSTQFKKGQKPHNFKGVSYTKSRVGGREYRLIYMPDHPKATSKGYVREHRVVMEKLLGRILNDDEVVDHINRFDTLNNDPSNLRVMKKVDHDRMNVRLNIHRRWYDQTNKGTRL